MLAHKVFMIASAFHGQQLLRPLAACTLSLPYATSQAMLRLGTVTQLHVATLAPLASGISCLCSQGACLLGGRMHRLSQ